MKPDVCFGRTCGEETTYVESEGQSVEQVRVAVEVGFLDFDCCGALLEFECPLTGVGREFRLPLAFCDFVRKLPFPSAFANKAGSASGLGSSACVPL